MKISQKLIDAINTQINKELYSSYLYLSMAAYFENKNLSGFAKWMFVQAKEENEHAMKFFQYLCERGAKVELKPIEGPTTDWASPLNVFEDVYAHEKKVSEMIINLLELAKSEKDYATENFLQWFVKEQVEEEANASVIVEKLKLVKENVGALFIIDKELGSRE